MTDDSHSGGGLLGGTRRLGSLRRQRQAPMAGPGTLVRSHDTRPTPGHFDSQRALDWLNFFVAALLMGFGPFIAVHLADHGWVPASIGFVLTASGLAGLLTQVPAGELIDMAQSKRALVAAAVAAVIVAALIYALQPSLPPVLAAAVMLGIAGSVLGPGIAAISLGLVGHEALAERLGRNQRFASIGGLTAAAAMGAIGYVLSTRDILLLAAALGIPALVALVGIRAGDIHFARSCGSHDDHPTDPKRASRAVLFKDSRLLTFAICLFLFQLANASLLPLISEHLAHADGRRSSLVVSALVVIPQIIVALSAPLVGRTANTWGRRPLLLIGLGAVPIRSTLFALTADPTLLVMIQLLDGLSGAVLGVLTALIVADLTKGTGRFNLAQGLIGTLSGVGASLSTSVSGIVVARFGQTTGFLSVAIVGLLAVAILWLFMPETKPSAQQRSGVR